MRIPKRRSENNKNLDFDPYISQHKADQLKAEIEKMIKIIRPKLVKEVEEHAKLGDFSENAAYQLAKGKLRGLNNRILVLQNMLNKAIIIDPPKNNNTISLGNIVTVKFAGQEYEYQILGSNEADPSKGVISQHSPIGSALLGHKINDEVEVEVNNKKNKYKILKIKTP